MILEDWDASFDRGISKAKMKRNIPTFLFYITEKNLIILVKQEKEKPLAIGIGRRACQESSGVLFSSSFTFFLEEVLQQTRILKINIGFG